MASLDQIFSYIKSINETLNSWIANAKKFEELPVMDTVNPDGLLMVSDGGISKQLSIEKLIENLSIDGQDNKVREILLGTITDDQDLAYLLDNSGITVSESEIIIITALATVNSTLVQKQYLWKKGKGEYNPIGSDDINSKLLELQPKFLNEIIVDELTSSPQAVVYDFDDIEDDILDVLNATSPAKDYTDEEKIYYIRYSKDSVNYLLNFIGINGIYGDGELQMDSDDLVLVYSSANTGENFVDLISNQRIRGQKTFEETVVFRGDATDSYTSIRDDNFKFLKNQSSEEDAGSVTVTTVDNPGGDYTQQFPARNGIVANVDQLDDKADLVGGKVPQSQLPSYVDDILEGYLLSNVFYIETSHTTIIPAEVGKIYVDLTTGQKNKQYRYSGSTYIQITNGLIASTNDVPEGTDLYFTTARVLATVLTGISFATGGAIVSTDSVLVAFGKIQKQLTDGFTGANIRSLLGITTLSGSNTGDETTTTLKTKIDEYLSFALSDEASNLVVGNLISFRMPYAMTLTEVRISLNTAPTVSSVIVDVKESGVSIFSTLVSIDATELTSTTAATPAVISDANLADDALITISTTQIGSGNAGKGLKITLKGKKA